MRHTTIELSDALMQQAERFAAVRGRRLDDVMADALAEKLGREDRPAGKASPAGSTLAEPFHVESLEVGGPQPGIDFNSNASIQEALDREFIDPATGKMDFNKLR